MSASAVPSARLALALDTGDRDVFRRWVELFAPRVGILKVGLAAFVRWGPEAVAAVRDEGAEVFLDIKLHDIPSTVARAVDGARQLGVRYLTVHAAGGPAMLGAAVEAAAGEVALLAVTVLTHLDAAELAALDLSGPGAERVAGWTRLARAAGVAGVVCSPREVAILRFLHPPPFLLATPGIRPRGSARDDQRRVATPRQAAAAGADLLVVGRPVTAAPDPLAALEAIEREIAAAGAGG